MSIEEIWPTLAPETREWLIAHNGEPIPTDVASAINGADVSVDPTAGRRGATPGIALSDEDVDWIEAVANDEDPARG
ncbi:hypothetical protein [Microbacterium sp. Leaf320]|uniref:hypothetical protein n=1 Tax=Microbacterium sp. Leaf320 TaxID=1736334 RepID=UPI0006F97070|nr:hypothetical protein [Microbacterium sp. Leaf320]KQQ67470.1 hypothetical protein ASF63_05905 [Microbacterium sp. Leaf320]